ncbi:hypothetical protein JB92DRAFT_2844798 [Gautieria morchelliformis]|nr:hypothetical protein JB92DRAFT_2844798 [Gautieria morchelliformis]
MELGNSSLARKRLVSTMLWVYVELCLLLTSLCLHLSDDEDHADNMLGQPVSSAHTIHLFFSPIYVFLVGKAGGSDVEPCLHEVIEGWS